MGEPISIKYKGIPLDRLSWRTLMEAAKHAAGKPPMLVSSDGQALPAAEATTSWLEIQAAVIAEVEKGIGE